MWHAKLLVHIVKLIFALIQCHIVPLISPLRFSKYKNNLPLNVCISLNMTYSPNIYYNTFNRYTRYIYVLLGYTGQRKYTLGAIDLCLTKQKYTFLLINIHRNTKIYRNKLELTCWLNTLNIRQVEGTCKENRREKRIMKM